jgi:hypothetical protein
MKELNKVLDMGGFFCFARGHAKQANEFDGPGGSRGSGSNHGASD